MITYKHTPEGKLICQDVFAQIGNIFLDKSYDVKDPYYGVVTSESIKKNIEDLDSYLNVPNVKTHGTRVRVWLYYPRHGEVLHAEYRALCQLIDGKKVDITKV